MGISALWRARRKGQSGPAWCPGRWRNLVSVARGSPGRSKEPALHSSNASQIVSERYKYLSRRPNVGGSGGNAPARPMPARPAGRERSAGPCGSAWYSGSRCVAGPSAGPRFAGARPWTDTPAGPATRRPGIGSRCASRRVSRVRGGRMLKWDRRKPVRRRRGRPNGFQRSGTSGAGRRKHSHLWVHDRFRARTRYRSRSAEDNTTAWPTVSFIRRAGSRPYRQPDTSS
jgi:hypothetical protein